MKRKGILIAAGAVVVIVAAAVGILMFTQAQAQEAERLAKYGPCGTEVVKQAGADLMKLIGRFNDANKVAEATGRGYLGPQITIMQAIRRDIDSITVPDCLASVKADYESGMSEAIDGYIAFMAQNKLTEEKAFENATKFFRAANDQLLRVKICAPDCKIE